MDKTLEYISLNIKKYRQLLNLSQAKLSENCSLSSSYIAEIEISRRTPSIKTLIIIARALNVETYRLLLPPNNDQSREEIKAFSKTLLNMISNDIDKLTNKY